MKKLISKYQMVTRVDNFGSKHVTLFPQHSVAGEVLAAVRSGRERLAQLLSARVSVNAMVRKCSSLRTESRHSLHTLLVSVVRTAGVLGLDTFRLPARATDQQLIDAGHSFATDAKPFKEQFVRHGMPPEFPENVNAVVDGFERAIGGHVDARIARKIAIRDFNATLEAALSQVSRFEALVLNTMRGDLAVMSAWEAARRVPPVVSKTAATTESGPDSQSPPVSADPAAAAPPA